MVRPTPEFRLMLAHNADFYPDDTERFARQKVKPAVSRTRVPRARPKHTLAGTITHNGTDPAVTARLYHIELGDPTNLPRPRSGVYLGVSALTIQAVLRMNDRLDPDQRRPTDDLLCLYSEVWKDGRRLGVRGLSRPEPVRRPPSDIILPAGHIEACIQNASPYGVALYPHTAPDEVGPEDQPLISMPSAPHFMRADHDESLDVDLSDQLGIPVYDTRANGAVNLDPSTRRPGEFFIASPNVPLAAGAVALDAGVIVQARTVRSIQHEDRGVVVGGRDYGILGASVLTSYQV